ncbi:MAG: metallophosphoesterase [Thermoplasmata archaeon]
MDEVRVLPGVTATRDFALYLEREKALVISDLHLGYEGALRQQGVSLPRFQKQHMIERLGHLLDRYAPEKLVVAGDFKHEFSRNLREEWREVLDVLDFLEGKVEPVLIRGNHDNFLPSILHRKGLELHRPSHRLGRFAVAHGHEPVEAPDGLIMGHEHPALRLKDTIGASLNLPCFIVSRDLIILPAFSPLAHGSDVLRGPYLSPMVTRKAVLGSQLYGLDEKLGVLEFGRAEDLLQARS